MVGIWGSLTVKHPRAGQGKVKQWFKTHLAHLSHREISPPQPQLPPSWPQPSTTTTTATTTTTTHPPHCPKKTFLKNIHSYTDSQDSYWELIQTNHLIFRRVNQRQRNQYLLHRQSWLLNGLAGKPSALASSALASSPLLPGLNPFATTEWTSHLAPLFPSY